MKQTVPRKRIKPGTKLVLLIMPVIIVAGGWMLWQELQQSPIRQAGIPLPAYGVVTIDLTTAPFPPTVSDNVQLTVRLNAPGGRMAEVDQVTYRYGPIAGTDTFQGQMQASSMDAFQAALQFTSPGDWWIEVNLAHQGTSGSANFTLTVQE